MEFAPHSNGLLKANTRELEFIAGTKLIENKRVAEGSVCQMWMMWLQGGF